MNEYADPIPKLLNRVYYIRLTSGEEIVGMLTRHTEKQVVIENPMQLMYMHDLLILSPYALFSLKKSVAFNLFCVATVIEVDDPLKELYRLNYHRSYDKSRHAYNEAIYKSIAITHKLLSGV